MLGKMIIHGAIAAILIAGAAAVYAQAKDGEIPVTPPVQATTPAPAGNGYLQPADGWRGKHKDGRKHASRSEPPRSWFDRDARRNRHRHHDDD